MKIIDFVTARRARVGHAAAAARASATPTRAARSPWARPRGSRRRASASRLRSLEPFSSAGGVPILFDGAGAAPARTRSARDARTSWRPTASTPPSSPRPATSRGRRRLPELLRNLGGGAACGRRGGAAPGPRQRWSRARADRAPARAQRRRHVRAGLRPRRGHGLLDARAAFERLSRDLRTVGARRPEKRHR